MKNYFQSKNRFAVIGFVLIASIGIAISFGGTTKPRSVETVRVKRGEIVDFIKTTGRVEAVEDVIIRARAAGRIEKVLKDEGDKVTDGDELVRFDISENEDSVKMARLKLEQAEIAIIEAKSKLSASETAHSDPSERELNLRSKETLYRQAVLSYESAERELNTARELYKIQVESLISLQAKEDRFKKAETDLTQVKRELEDASVLFSKREKTRINLTTLKTEYERSMKQKAVAETEMEMAISQRNRLKVVSPLTGTIVSKDVKAGMTVPVGEALLTVADIDRLRVRSEVDEVDAGRIAKGQEASITFEAFPGRKFQGHVDKIAPRALIKGERTVVEVLIVIDDRTDLLRVGNQVDARIVLEKKGGALTIPMSALGRGSSSYVHLYRSGYVSKVVTKTGLSDMESIEIVDGLKEGDEVVLSSIELKDGERVDIR